MLDIDANPRGGAEYQTELADERWATLEIEPGTTANQPRHPLATQVRRPRRHHHWIPPTYPTRRDRRDFSLAVSAATRNCPLTANRSFIGVNALRDVSEFRVPQRSSRIPGDTGRGAGGARAVISGRIAVDKVRR